MGWQSSSSGKTPAQEASIPEFKLQYHQKIKINLK
jgi:hypothetical protein